MIYLNAGHVAWHVFQQISGLFSIREDTTDRRVVVSCHIFKKHWTAFKADSLRIITINMFITKP